MDDADRSHDVEATGVARDATGEASARTMPAREDPPPGRRASSPRSSPSLPAAAARRRSDYTAVREGSPSAARADERTTDRRLGRRSGEHRRLGRAGDRLARLRRRSSAARSRCPTTTTTRASASSALALARARGDRRPDRLAARSTRADRASVGIACSRSAPSSSTARTSSSTSTSSGGTRAAPGAAPRPSTASTTTTTTSRSTCRRVDEAAHEAIDRRRPRVRRGVRGEHTGEILPYVSTEASARDIDSIRRALGEEQISYFGFSYGSELGAVWIKLFPDTVRAAVIDGASDPNADSVQGGLDQAKGFERQLDAFLADCSERLVVPVPQRRRRRGRLRRPDGRDRRASDRGLARPHAGDPGGRVHRGHRRAVPAEHAGRTWPRRWPTPQAATGRVARRVRHLLPARPATAPTATRSRRYHAITCLDDPGPRSVEGVDADVPLVPRSGPPAGCLLRLRLRVRAVAGRAGRRRST